MVTIGRLAIAGEVYVYKPSALTSPIGSAARYDVRKSTTPVDTPPPSRHPAKPATRYGAWSGGFLVSTSFPMSGSHLSLPHGQYSMFPDNYERFIRGTNDTMRDRVSLSLFPPGALPNCPR